jgi:general secretion pathway protein G
MVLSARRRHRLRAHGFSLIELMVVIAIMGLLATVVAVNLMGRTYGAKVTKVMADFDSMKKAIQMFKIDTGSYPDRLDDLWAQPGGKKGWKGPYLDNAPPAPVDPWGNVYIYSKQGNSKFLLSSLGADGAPSGQGEDQDLTSDNIQQVNQNLTGQ